jgi:ParB family chromosome partitioning protein
MLDPPELTDEQAARLEAIEARRSELEELMQDEALDEDQFKALDSEDDALMAEAEAIENRLPVLPDELKPHVGAFLLLTPQGEMRLDTQFFSEQPIQRIDDEAQGEVRRTTARAAKRASAWQAVSASAGPTRRRPACPRKPWVRAASRSAPGSTTNSPCSAVTSWRLRSSPNPRSRSTMPSSR